MPKTGEGLVIVAIPSVDDIVWKISSEKVPHMTLMFLGDQSKNPNLARMEGFIQHVVDTSMYRFGLSVDRRDFLGDHEADVLFFNNSYTEDLKRFRSFLLEDRNIFEAYHSTYQYPTWTPHLTLGYPDTPAKPDKRDYPGIHWVNFDRIAFWTGDYEGPEFLLKDRGEELAVMSDEVDEFLSHVGVKGMKWGIRKAPKIESSDAKVVRKAREKQRTSGTSSLSNKELQRIISRMNLEKQYSDLKRRDTDPGLKFLKQNAPKILSIASLFIKKGNPLVDIGFKIVQTVVAK